MSLYWWEVGFMISRAFSLSMSTYHITKYCSKRKRKKKHGSYKKNLPSRHASSVIMKLDRITQTKINRFENLKDIYKSRMGTSYGNHILMMMYRKTRLKAVVCLKHSSRHHGRDCTSQILENIADWAIIETTCLDDWYWPR